MTMATSTDRRAAPDLASFSRFSRGAARVLPVAAGFAVSGHEPDTCPVPNTRPLGSDGALCSPDAVAALTPALLRYALRVVGRREEAEDLVQETWISALRSAGSFEGRATLLSWLIGIMRRRIADRYRRQRYSVPLHDDDFAVDWSPAPDRIDARDAMLKIASSFSQLTAREREAVQLCDLEELERDEAAARMRVQRGHLRVILHRAHRKLGDALGEPAV